MPAAADLWRRAAALAPVLAGLLLAPLPGRAAEPTRYPLLLRNCGAEIRIAQPPQRVVSIGQATTEILLSLGLSGRMVGTAVWVGPVLPRFAAENARIPRLADNDPSFEAVVGQAPDLVAAQLEWHVGARGRVGQRAQFEALGIPAYVSPADCTGKDNSGSGDGTRRQPFGMALIHQEIRELAAIFDVAGRGEALVAELRQREAAAIAAVAGLRARGLSAAFWYSSRSVQGDAFIAGRNGGAGAIMRALGLRNVVESDEEWPSVSWEAIAAADPSVLVIAEMERRRFPADDVAVKRRFLETDPVASQMRAVREGRIIVLDARAMNPSIRTIDGIEAVARGLAQLGAQLGPAE
ncbi:ABC transporter substrate-binding protein [Pseudoroseomonas cervicalis]|uniref:ABC transporter substrate-binding protein n=1 Tax=Teichococcus cervicalis TaxID=204525 RepID=UPI0022F195FD|nr:ABC transporter substrate-binding protein [Pseudoroseomonas cervicalis]WBV44380.1 ABC transporter substrate-binding protein [Pseudoroseomonas cervicalis]